MWQRLCSSETIYLEVPHQLMGDGCPVKAAIALKADYLSKEKKETAVAIIHNIDLFCKLIRHVITLQSLIRSPPLD